MNLEPFFKKNSMTSKILLTLLVLILLQAAIFLGALLMGSIQSDIRDSSFQSFDDKIKSRRNTVENLLISTVYKTEIYEALVKACQQLKEDTLQGTPLKVNTEIAEHLKGILHNTASSGAFVLFEEIDGVHQGLNIRDSEPTISTPRNGDLFAVYGPSDTIKEMGLTLDYNWKPTLRFDQPAQSYDFYHKPFNVYPENQQKAAIDYGYWSTPYHLSAGDEPLISFSFPLLDEQGEAFGVIGIDFTVEYLKSILPYDEIDNGNGAFLFGYRTNPDLNFQSLLVSGPLYQNINDTFTLSKNKENLYTLDDAQKADTIASVHKLNLYNPDSPFINESWELIGAVNDTYLLTSFRPILQSLLLSLAITIIAGLFCSFFVAIYFAKPFVILLKTLKRIDPNEPVSLPRVKMEELDQISSIMENMSNNIHKSASRLSNIIKLMDMPFGAIEIDLSTDRVFYTDKIAKLLYFSSDKFNKQFMSFREFKEEMKNFEEFILVKNSETETRNDGSDTIIENHTLQIQYQNESPSWVKLSILWYETQILISVNDVTKEMDEKIKLEYERDYDGLTNLLNRRAFHEKFDEIVKDGSLKKAALVLWDLDNLKYINDNYGHDWGDLYIKETAITLMTLDNRFTLSSRMAGDEFLVFVHGLNTQEDILAMIHNLHAEMSKKCLYFSGETFLHIHSSVGIAWYEEGIRYEDLLKYADYAMYTAKKNLKGTVQVFNPKNYKEDYILFDTADDFNRILNEKLFRFAFQPIVDVNTAEIFGYEALIRPEGTLLRNPTDLLRMARSQSKLQNIETLTFVYALKTYEEQKKAFKNTHIFINSIPKIVWEQRQIERFEKSFPDALSHLVIEIIESDRLTEENLNIKMEAINRWKASIALDDFGSGYNNETAILQIHPHFIKVDRELIHGIVYDDRRQIIVSNLIHYAKTQGIKVIGEGIESKSELEFLIKAGIDYAQGFYISRPMFKVKDLSENKKLEILSLHHKKNS